MKPELKIEKVNGEVTASISGELTIKYQKEMKRLFQELSEAGPSVVSVSSPDQVDLCFLQLWWCFLREMRAAGNVLKTESVLPQSEEQLLKRLNLLTLLQ